MNNKRNMLVQLHGYTEGECIIQQGQRCTVLSVRHTSAKNMAEPARPAAITARYSCKGPDPRRLLGVTTWMPCPSHLQTQHAWGLLA